MPTDLFSITSWRPPGRVVMEPRKPRLAATLVPSIAPARYSILNLGPHMPELRLSFAIAPNRVRAYIIGSDAPEWMSDEVRAWLRPLQPDQYAELVIHAA